MPRAQNAETLAKVHEEALIQFDRIQSAVKDERSQCLEDRRFYSIPGAQWEGPLSEQFENKPKFEVNKVHLAVIRIINEYRNNRITVDFVSKDGSANESLADTCDGLYRADEQDSGAEEAMDNAFEEAVGGGFGALRLRSVYEDEEDDENEKQRIRIEPIYDADSCVFFDLDAKRQDKADAKHCYVLTSQTPQAYEDEWDDDPASWPKSITDTEFDWSTPNLVYLAEYYRVEEKKEWVRIFEAIDGSEERYSEHDFEVDEKLEEMLFATGRKEVRRKRATRKKVRKYIMSGSRILEDCGFIAGNVIPIVPVYGKRWFIDGVERCMGHVRLAKDPQRLKNMQLSKLAEISAFSSIEKPIFLPEQVKGLEMRWAESNIRDYPYELLNPITDANGQVMPAGAIGYTKPPQIPPAMAALLALTEQDMNEILGNPQGADKMVANISGKAVELIQTRLDMQTYIYISNFAKAIKRVGEIWLAMAREKYVEEGRPMKTIGSQGEMGTVNLMKPMMNEKTMAMEFENDLTAATFDVAIEVGPSSTSKRDATVRKLMEMQQITQDPETTQVLQSMTMLNMEGEGIADVRDFFRVKLVKMGVIKPTDEEAQAMAQAAQNQPPDPNVTLANALAKEAEANAAKAHVQTIDTLAASELKRANTEKAQADTAAILADITLADQNHAINAIQKLSGNQPTANQAEMNGVGQ